MLSRTRIRSPQLGFAPRISRRHSILTFKRAKDSGSMHFRYICQARRFLALAGCQSFETVLAVKLML